MENAVRAAETEAIFREVNEAVTEQHADNPTVTVLCECANDSCTAGVTMLRAEYEQVRTDATHFIVLPDHIAPGVEVIVEEHPSYWVIRKTGKAGEVAEERDPRRETSD